MIKPGDQSLLLLWTISSLITSHLMICGRNSKYLVLNPQLRKMYVNLRNEVEILVRIPNYIFELQGHSIISMKGYFLSLEEDNNDPAILNA